jgi:hypothetical protein
MQQPALERLARVLMIAGASVAVLGVSAWALDAIPPMPAWMMRLAIYKLTLVGAAGLIIVGAFLRRAARESAGRRGDTGEHSLESGALSPVDREVRQDAGDIAEGHGPAPAQVRREGVGSPRLPH